MFCFEVLGEKMVKLLKHINRFKRESIHFIAQVYEKLLKVIIIITKSLFYSTILLLLFVFPLIQYSNNSYKIFYEYIVNNSTYFGLVFTILTIYIPLYSAKKQNSLQLKQFLDEQKRRDLDRQEREKRDAKRLEVEQERIRIQELKKQEIELNSVRPIFMINKVKEKRDGDEIKRTKTDYLKLDVFIKDNVFIDNVILYIKKFKDLEGCLTAENIGPLKSGNIKFINRPENIEMVVISCTTIMGELIFYQYHTRGTSYQIRLMKNDDLIRFSKEVLKRTSLNEFTDNKTYGYYEIYKSSIENRNIEEHVRDRFVKILKEIKNYEKEKDIQQLSQDLKLNLMIALEQEDIGEVISRTLENLEGAYSIDRLTIITFLRFLQELPKYPDFLDNIICSPMNDMRYFVRNINNLNNLSDGLLTKYKEMESINFNDILNYTYDIQTILTEWTQTDFEVERSSLNYALRNIFVYFSENVHFSDNASEIVKEVLIADVRNKLKEICFKNL